MDTGSSLKTPSSRISANSAPAASHVSLENSLRMSEIEVYELGYAARTVDDGKEAHQHSNKAQQEPSPFPPLRACKGGAVAKATYECLRVRAGPGHCQQHCDPYQLASPAKGIEMAEAHRS